MSTDDDQSDWQSQPNDLSRQGDIVLVLLDYPKNRVCDTQIRRGMIPEISPGVSSARTEKCRMSWRVAGLVVNLYNQRERGINEICQLMGISKPTLYKYVEEVNV